MPSTSRDQEERVADKTKIEWSDATWNPITGCTVLTPGCTNCYAMRLAGTRLRNHPSRRGLTKMSKAGPVWNGEVRLNDYWLDQPLKWKRPRRVFVCAHGDLFHESIPDEWIDKVFAVMACAGNHTFQVLTKRPKRMCDAVARIGKPINILDRQARLMGRTLKFEGLGLVPWPLPNVWLGVSAERQIEADERVPLLLQTAAAVRFVSAEPLLEAIDFGRIVRDALFAGKIFSDGKTHPIGWIIVGGESGPKHRPMEEQWARDIIADCETAGVAAFMKQMAGKAPIPPHLMVRQFPNPLRVPQHH